MLTGPGATIGNARSLRRQMSPPEVLLWSELRKRPRGFKFRRQHPAGPFVLDFACLKAKLAIEVDGEAHDRGAVHLRDQARDEWLANQGFGTLRVNAGDVFAHLEGVVQLVVSRCAAVQPLHHASHGPPPRAGEDHDYGPRAMSAR